MPTLDLVRRQDGANIRASEGAGTTTLASQDSRWQVFNLSAARSVLLPSTNILAGDIWTINNRSSSFALTVKSSDNTTITTVTNGGIKLAALQDAPTSSSHWLISPGSDYLPGKAAGAVDGAAIAAGYVGERIQSGATYTQVTSGFTNGQYKTIASISLNKGVYLLRGCVLFGGNTNSTAANLGIAAAISAFPDNTTTDHLGVINTSIDVTNGTSNDAHIEISDYYVVVSADSTPYYYKANASNWQSNPVIRGHLSAVRIA